MAEKDLKKIADAVVAKTPAPKKHKKPKKAKYENPSSRPSDPSDTTYDKTSKGVLEMLKTELKTPFLGLLEEYVKRSSPNKDEKDFGKTMYFFKENHKTIYYICMVLDFVLRLIYIAIVIIVGFRGLNLLPFCQ